MYICIYVYLMTKGYELKDDGKDKDKCTYVSTHI